MNQAYEKRIKVTQYECDFKDTMKVSYLLRHSEQVAGEGGNLLGLTKDLYKRTQTAFLLSKISLEVYKDIKMGDELKIVTRPFMPIRVVYTRHTLFYNQNEEIVAAIDSKWILVNTKTRRILRQMPEEFNIGFVEKLEEDRSMKIEKASSFTTTQSFKINYSNIDVNGHLNNACYADIICDSLPFDAFKGGSIKNIIIFYHKEVLANDEIKVMTAPIIENKKYYVCAENANLEKSFEAMVEF